MSERPPAPPVPLDVRPAPLPVGPTGSGRTRTTVVVLATLASLVALCCCCSSGMPPGLVGLMEGVASEQVIRVGMGGGGRYVIVEHGDPEGEADGLRIVAVDRETGERHEIRGCHLLAVEPSATIAWVSAVREDGIVGGLTWAFGEQVFADSLGCDGTSYDSPPHSLLVWRFAESGHTSAEGVDEWEPIEGEGGVSVLLGVAEREGAMPSSLAVIRSAGETPTAVPLPRGFRTFRPAGWSSSGRYFAVVELPSSEARARAPRVAVIDAETEAVCASLAVDGGDPTDHWDAPRVAAAWDGEWDLMWVMTLHPADGEMSLATLDPATGATRRHDPPSGRFGMPPAHLGTHAGAPLLSDGGSVWTMRAGKVREIADAPSSWRDLEPIAVTGEGDAILVEWGPFSQRILEAPLDGSGEPEVVWTAEQTRGWRWPWQ